MCVRVWRMCKSTPACVRVRTCVYVHVGVDAGRGEVRVLPIIFKGRTREKGRKIPEANGARTDFPAEEDCMTVCCSGTDHNSNSG